MKINGRKRQRETAIKTAANLYHVKTWFRNLKTQENISQIQKQALTGIVDRKKAQNR